MLPPLRPTAPTPLRYLVFDLALGDEDRVALDAQASLRATDAEGIAAATAEAEQVLAWARQRGLGEPGPLDEGHAWDQALHHHTEPGGWHTVALTLSGPAALAEALEADFPGAVRGAEDGADPVTG